MVLLVKEKGVGFGTILVHIDPLTLVKKTPLRCFGEEHQEKLHYYLKTFLDLEGEFEGSPLK